MKKILLLCLLLMLVTLCVSPRAEAFLINRGTDTLGNRLIYDDDLDITWYDYSNAENTWANQVAWASGLSVTFDGDTYDDWRLPTTVDGTLVSYNTPSYYNGTGPNGYNITTSEMGHLFYTELGNKGYYATDGTNPQPGWGLNNTGDLQNLIDYYYWSGTEYSVNETTDAWFFNFGYGLNAVLQKISNVYGVAVRSGDVAAVPEPTLGLLIGISLVGLVGVGAVRKIKQRKVANS